MDNCPLQVSKSKQLDLGCEYIKNKTEKPFSLQDDEKNDKTDSN